MLDQIKSFLATEVLARDGAPPRGQGFASLGAVTAQLLVATAAGSTLEQLSREPERADSRGNEVPRPLTWAPLLIGPLTAAATLQNAYRPTARTGMALRFLTRATIGFGSSLFLFDLFAHRNHPPTRFGSVAFASAGLLALVFERQQRQSAEIERSLRKRARVVERIVPRRKAKLDRIVVHV